MKYMAFDVGQKRIGVASCDELELVASPLCVVKAGKTAIDEIVKLIQKEGAKSLVVGLPVSLDGVERASCERARFFKNRLCKQIKLPCEFYDESFSSKVAEQELIEAEVGFERRKELIDAAAAAVILRSFLENKKSKG